MIREKVMMFGRCRIGFLTFYAGKESGFQGYSLKSSGFSTGQLFCLTSCTALNPCILLGMANAIYPGTFDPVTSGHLDILHRACHIFDKVVVGVAHNMRKEPLFSVQERVDLITGNLDDPKLSVTSFDGLVVECGRAQNASVLIRGLRAVSDFEFEFQMTQMNRDLDPEIEPIFLMPSARYFFTSSTLMKQVSMYDPEKIEKFVPLNVAAALKRKFNHD